MIRIARDPLNQLSERRRTQGLEGLGQLASQQYPPLATQHLLHVLQTLKQTVRRLVDHPGPVFRCKRLQTLPTPVSLGRKKPLKGKAVRRHTRRTERGNQGTGPRHRRYSDTSLARLTHQVVTGVGDQRRTGIGNQGNIITGQQTLNQPLTLIPFIMVMTGRHRRINTEMLHQPGAVAGVLGSNQADILEHLKRSRTHILKITDRRSHHKKSTGNSGHGIS